MRELEFVRHVGAAPEGFTTVAETRFNGDQVARLSVNETPATAERRRMEQALLDLVDDLQMRAAQALPAGASEDHQRVVQKRLATQLLERLRGR
jgi:hypothetical protein